MANEVAVNEKNEVSFSVGLTTALANVQDGLPQNFNVTRFVQNAVALLNGNESLADYAKQHGTAQIKQGMVRAAIEGLDFMNKEAYLIPYGSKLDYRRSYIGDIKTVKKYSVRPVLDIYAKVVREGDSFEEGIENGKPYVNFKPEPFNSKPVIGAFAVCLFKDGGMIYDTMSLTELNAARDKSKMKNSMPWKDFPWEMQKKTVIHRLCKGIELEFENPKQREYFDEDVAIETDIEATAQAEIAENANTVDFVEPVVDEVQE